MEKPETFSALKQEQKQAVGLLSMGTFLEYFDLMLYVHMAMLLNDLFFPPSSDPYTVSLYSAAAFCSTFVFRPLGALVFGWIGDNFGRKTTVIITTTLMAASCLAIANLPTYETIGITATILLTLCRAIQGMSSMGEIIGAEIYITETTKPPIQYPLTAMIVTLSTLGTFFALSVATFVTSMNLNWRIAFWFGALIAVIGIIARTTLRETPDFADAKRYLEKVKSDVSKKINVNLNYNNRINEKVNRKTALSYFLIECMWPVTFYFTYLHCSNVLKDSFGYSSQQVIQHNLIVSIVNFVGYVILTYLSYKIYPLKIVKFRLKIACVFIILSPFFLESVTSPLHVLFIQSFFIIFRPDAFPAVPIYIKHFPIFRRFSATSWLFASSRVLMHLVTSFGLIYLVKYFNHFGILILMVVATSAFMFGINHFEKLEREAGNYY